MTFRPWLPAEWNAVCFQLKWHRNTVAVSVCHSSATFMLAGPKALARRSSSMARK
jgi:trehalose/maltose hydrolase-like predicted phosphorylase